MKVERHLRVPTGDILVVRGSAGKLEMLSLADYGQHVNLNQNKPVVDGTPLLPLTEKWVITVSTQYGCSMGCQFCSPAGTLVNTPCGMAPIELLKTGDLVVGRDCKSNSVRINTVDEVGKRLFRGNLVEFEFDNGETLRVTPDHPIILSDGSTVLASDILEGDDVIGFV